MPTNAADIVVVPEGYLAQIFMPWDEQIGIQGNMPARCPDGSNSAADQQAHMGMHHDSMHFYSLDGSRRGLLVMNHEYIDDGLLHADGIETWSVEKVCKAQAAHGVSVIEVEQRADGWHVVRPSRYARRFTSLTPFAVQGPAAGHSLMRTEADPAGRTVSGTLTNCATGKTPWGTYLLGEENFAFYFEGGETIAPDHLRYGMTKVGWNYRWAEHDARFDARKNPNEFNRFGWLVEIDPTDPDNTPIKRTAIGRAAHQGAWTAVTRDGRVAVYTGEDAKFEYLYKFVSQGQIAPGGGKANRELLDHGTLYVARFDADGRGRWLPLAHGQGPLIAARGFADQGEVLIKARQAADALGGTRMDRPGWLAINAARREVYCTLTNNNLRGKEGHPGVDPANPRANNAMGSIIYWKEDGDFDATQFSWNHLMQAGDPGNTRPEARGNIEGDIFGCPAGLTFDSRGVLWIQTDLNASEMNKGEFARIGNNQLLACDLFTGEVRRFLTGPVSCEITGLTFTPDGRTMFLNVQHPGGPPAYRTEHADIGKRSTWPDHQKGGRPRSATVIVRRTDGGIIGA